MSGQSIAEQVEGLRNHADERQRNGWMTSAHNLRAAATIIEKQDAALAKLREYAWHKNNCGIVTTGQPLSPCTCGLAELIRSLTDGD